jgi:methanogenic corrinoid protein MtbC1
MTKTTSGDSSSKRHPIQVVSRRTGVSVDLLRAWERRYLAVVPARTATGRRLYSDDDIDRLRLLREAMVAGRRIGDLAPLSVAGLRDLIAGDVRHQPPVPAAEEGSVDPTPVIEEALAAIRDLDGVRLRVALTRAAHSTRPMSFFDEIAVPLMQRVGAQWHGGEMSPSHEHLASVVLRQLLSEMLASLQPGAPAPLLVVATPAGERHDIGAVAVAVAAAVDGWVTTYLGPDLPAADVASAVRSTGAKAVALSVTIPTKNAATEIESIARALAGEAIVLVGGQGAVQPATRRADGAVYLADLIALRATLRSLRSQNQPPNAPR